MQFKRYLKYAKRFLFGVVLGVLSFLITDFASQENIYRRVNNLENNEVINFFSSFPGMVTVNIILIVIIVINDLIEGNYIESRKYYKELNIFIGEIFVTICAYTLALAIASSM